MSRQKEIVLNRLIRDGIPEITARYIVSVSAFETGDWTSKIYRKNHNLFGMRLPKIRRTTAIGERSGHAVYISDEESIKDFLLYFDSLDYPVNYNNLFEFITLMKKKGYFTADFSTYYNGVQAKHRKLFNQVA